MYRDLLNGIGERKRTTLSSLRASTVEELELVDGTGLNDEGCPSVLSTEDSSYPVLTLESPDRAVPSSRESSPTETSAWMVASGS